MQYKIVASRKVYKLTLWVSINGLVVPYTFAYTTITTIGVRSQKKLRYKIKVTYFSPLFFLKKINWHAYMLVKASITIREASKVMKLNWRFIYFFV